MLEQYFADAEIVVIGTVTATRPGATPEGTRYVAIDLTPQLSAGRAIKGDLEGITLATSDDSASCGVHVVVGETYLVFASRTTPGDRLAWFDTCNGSRLYLGGPRAAEMQPFVDLPNSQIVPHLFELAAASATSGTADDATSVGPPGSRPRFHTDPACWTQARTYHAGAPAAEHRERVKLSWSRLPPPPSEGVTSPNGAYRLWTRNPSINDMPPRTATIIASVERDQTLWIELRDVASPVTPTWVNEKLLFVRAWWGRLIGIDVLIDVEAGTLFYAEEIDAGTIAFEQYREACAGQCPCAPASAQATTDNAPPRSKPAPDEPAADLATLAKSLVYLDADWDGRVWSDAAGSTWVGSAVHGAGSAGERGEYPAEIRDVRETPAGPWLLVDLFAVSRCQDPHAKVVHRGWIPAFSSAGRLVAGSYPGGC